MSAALPIMLRAATRPEDENNNFFIISPGPGGTARLSHTHRAREPSASGGCSPSCCYEEERGKSPHHPLRRPHQHSSASSGRTFKRRNEWRKQPDQSSCCFTTHLVDGDEAFGVRVDAALLQETCCWDTSCSTETGIIPTAHIWAIRNYIIYCIFLLENKCVQVCATRKRGVLWRSFHLTCSDDAHISPQDLAAVQHDFFQLWEKNKMCWSFVLRRWIGRSLSFWAPARDGRPSPTPRSSCKTSPCLLQKAAERQNPLLKAQGMPTKTSAMEFLISTFIMAFPTFSPRACLKGTVSIPITETEWALSVRAAATSIPARGGG